MARDHDSTPKLEPTREFRPPGVSTQDATISKERSGVVHTKAAANSALNAMTPPLSKKPTPTSSVAERIRKRLKKGG